VEPWQIRNRNGVCDADGGKPRHRTRSGPSVYRRIFNGRDLIRTTSCLVSSTVITQLRDFLDRRRRSGNHLSVFAFITETLPHIYCKFMTPPTARSNLLLDEG
jgi:hypothetical protein